MQERNIRVGTRRIFIMVFLVSTLLLTAGAIAGNTALTEKEKQKNLGFGTYSPFRNIKVMEGNYGDGSMIDLSFTLTFFNTYDKTLTVAIFPQSFWEEREHIIRENYTYYRLPEMKWVTVTEPNIQIEPMSRYTTEIQVSMPKDEAFEKANGGGYIFLVSTEVYHDDVLGGLTEIYTDPWCKAFLTLLTPEMPGYKLGFPKVSSGSFADSPVWLPSVILIGIGGVFVAVPIFYKFFYSNKKDKKLRDYYKKIGGDQ